MSNYLDRLENELLSAGRAYQEGGATRSASVWRRGRRLTGIVPAMVSLAMTALVVVLATGIIHGSSQPATGHHGHGPVKPVPINPVQPKVTRVGACRSVATRAGAPPLVMSDGAPSAQLSSILSMARDPAGADNTAVIRGFNRNPSFVLTVFRRFIRVVNGERGVQVAFFPAVFCQETYFGPRFAPTRIRIAPEQGIITLPLYGSPKVTAATISTASLIRSGFALPGLDTPNRQWMQAVVVPDGVSKVVMHFTPPFLHHYSATATIHDNVGVIVRRPDYTPTSLSWYAPDGHLIRSFVDKKDLRLDNCLAAHRKNC